MRKSWCLKIFVWKMFPHATHLETRCQNPTFRCVPINIHFRHLFTLLWLLPWLKSAECWSSTPKTQSPLIVSGSLHWLLGWPCQSLVWWWIFGLDHSWCIWLKNRSWCYHHWQMLPNKKDKYPILWITIRHGTFLLAIQKSFKGSSSISRGLFNSFNLVPDHEDLFNAFLSPLWEA